MKFTVRVVVHADDETETVVRDAFILRREEPLTSDTLGLRLAEAQDLLAAVQDTLVENQVATALSTQVGVDQDTGKTGDESILSDVRPVACPRRRMVRRPPSSTQSRARTRDDLGKDPRRAA